MFYLLYHSLRHTASVVRCVGLYCCLQEEDTRCNNKSYLRGLSTTQTHTCIEIISFILESKDEGPLTLPAPWFQSWVFYCFQFLLEFF